MRVSWIDQEHLLSLVARLEEPAKDTCHPEEDGHTIETLELATLPDLAGFLADDVPSLEVPSAPTAPSHEDYFPDLPSEAGARGELAPDSDPAPANEVQQEEAESETETAIVAEDAALPLMRIRERLRLIRHRALEAGLLSRQEASSPSDASAPGESVPADSGETMSAEPESPEPQAGRPSGPDWLDFAERAAAILPADTVLLILDGDGGVVWSNDSRPGLVLSTLMARRAARHASVDTLAQDSIVAHIPLPPDHVLSVVHVLVGSMGHEIAVKGPAALEEAVALAWSHELTQND